MQEAYALGIRTFGENHAQAFREKQTFFEQAGCEAHFIGHLQTNKIKYVCGTARLIQSVDSPHLSDALQRKSCELGIVSDILLQVNIGDEAQKGGVAESDLGALAETVMACPNLRLRGLMCVPPALSPEEARPYFARMRERFARLASAYPAQPIDILSMGMSHDYAVAIAEGATMVRIGSALFGPRAQK